MKYTDRLNGDYLLRRYLGLSSDEIKDLDSFKKKSYIDAIKHNIIMLKRSGRIKMIKRLFLHT